MRAPFSRRTDINTMQRRAKLPLPAIMTRRLWSLAVRATVLTVMSFAIAFGFLSGTMANSAHYDPTPLRLGRPPCSARRAALWAFSSRASGE